MSYPQTQSIDYIYQLWRIEKHVLQQIDRLQRLDEASSRTSQEPFFTPENTKTLFHIAHQRMKIKHEFEKSLQLFIQSLSELNLTLEEICNEKQACTPPSFTHCFYDKLFKQIEKSHNILTGLGHPSTCSDCEGHGRASKYARVYELAFMTLNLPFSPIGLILFAGVFVIHFIDSLITAVRFNRSLEQAASLIPDNTNILFRELAQHVGTTLSKSRFFTETKEKLSQNTNIQHKTNKLTNNKHDCTIETMWNRCEHIKQYTEQSARYNATKPNLGL